MASAKRQALEAIEAAPDSEGLPEIIKRLYALVRAQRARKESSGQGEPGPASGAVQPPPSGPKPQQVLAHAHQPGEFVVIRGDEIRFHSRDESEAWDFYQETLQTPDGRYAVFVYPDEEVLDEPVARGPSKK